MEKDAKIFVAGGTGLVGSAIIRRLKAAGYGNIVSNSHRRRSESFLTGGDVRFSPLDLTRQSEVDEFFSSERPHYVFLAAAKVGGILANDTYKADFIYQNIMIASNVISAAQRCGVKKLLNLGSSCIYPKLAPQPMREEHLLTGTLEPTNEPYAIAKIAAIKLCRYFNEQYGTDFISVMPTNLFGPGDNYDLLNSHVLPALIRKFHLARLLHEKDYNGIIKDFLIYGNSTIEDGDFRLSIGRDATIDDLKKLLGHFGIVEAPGGNGGKAAQVVLWGTGTPYREFLYSDDLADAVIMLMRRFSYGDIGEFINIGTGLDLRISELAEMVREAVGFKGAISFDATKPDGTPRKLLDVSRIKALGWSASVTLREGITRAYSNYLETADARAAGLS